MPRQRGGIRTCWATGTHPEIEQELDGRAVTFVPHLVPLDRGILANHLRASPAGHDGGARLNDVMQAAYAAAPFVRLRGETLPEIKHVAYSNFCDIGWQPRRADRTRSSWCPALDNLVKGAAGQAVQNFNVMLGFDERAGLLA